MTPRLPIAVVALWTGFAVSAPAAGIESLRGEVAAARSRWEQLQQAKEGVVAGEELQRAELDVYVTAARLARRKRDVVDELRQLAQAVRIREQLVRRYKSLAEQGAATRADLDLELAALVEARVRGAELVGDAPAEWRFLKQLLIVEERQLARVEVLLKSRMIATDDAAAFRTQVGRTRQRMISVRTRIERAERLERKKRAASAEAI